MNNKSKNPSALQGVREKSPTVTLYIVCLLSFMFMGCGRQDSSFMENDESPYYYQYNGMGVNPMFEKTYISLNTRYISLTLKEPQLPVDIAQRGFITSEFQRDVFNGWPDYNENKDLYWTELDLGKVLTPVQYFEILADMKKKNRDVIVGPFFNSLGTLEGTKGFGTGYAFFVKLKSVGDEVLLEQMTEQTGCIIMWQNDFLPLWFKIGITEDSELNALECANIFYESGLFQSVEMLFMNDSEGKTDDFHIYE